MNVLRGPPLTLTSPQVMLETGPPGVQPQHGRYVRAPRPATTPPVVTPQDERATGLLLPVVMQFDD